MKISPDEKKLAFLYSSADRPWELYATLNQPNALITKITHSTTTSFDAYQWRKPPIINFKGEDGYHSQQDYISQQKKNQMELE